MSERQPDVQRNLEISHSGSTEGPSLLRSKKIRKIDYKKRNLLRFTARKAKLNISFCGMFRVIITDGAGRDFRLPSAGVRGPKLQAFHSMGIFATSGGELSQDRLDRMGILKIGF